MGRGCLSRGSAAARSCGSGGVVGGVMEHLLHAHMRRGAALTLGMVWGHQGGETGYAI